MLRERKGHTNKLLQSLYSAVRCPLNHRWQLIRESDNEVEHVCQKCGKRVIRRFNPPFRVSDEGIIREQRLDERKHERAG